jgi:hypothetical protein
MRRAVALACVIFCHGCGENEAERARKQSCDRLDAAWSLASVGASTAPVAHPELRELSGESKLAVAVYHFNVQYVAGGLIGFPDGEYVEKYHLDEAQVEDRIIRQGLEPVLDLFLAHPTFHADLELQAYMVELIALRHRDVLDKMRELALRGQIDFDSFHYSDQLYVAYPKRDLVVSLELTREVFARAGLPLGKSIFTQEGQFARGQIPIAQSFGYEASVLPKNLYGYQFGEDPADSVLYTDSATPEHAVILGGRGWHGMDANGTEVDLQWTFMDDGEIAFSVGGLNPYFGLDYEIDPARIADHVTRLEEMEAQGYKHATIAEAVRALKKRGVAFPQIPPVLDGTWQPRDTNNVLRWMGGSGLFRTYESDSETLSAIWRARTSVERAELEAGDGARGTLAAWREALLAQVSDSTGWNPFRTEIAYSRTRAEKAVELAGDVRVCHGVASDAPRILSCTPSTQSLSQLGVEVIAPARAITTTVETCSSSFGELSRITVNVPKLVDEELNLVDPTETESKERELEVRFRQEEQSFALASAFTDGAETIALDDYVFESIGIALPIGLIGLGPSRWLVQDLGSGRVAALLTRSGEGAGFVRFQDSTVTRAEGSTRRYYLAGGIGVAEARALAESINR